MIIIVMGPQGSGKGTQAEKLAEHLDLMHVSMGDVFRDEVEKHGPYADIVRKCMNEGKLIPREINNKIVENVVKKYRGHLILDGYPRNIRQAKFLTSFAQVDLVFCINISDEEAVNRISKRRICTSNHKVFIEGQITPEDIKECEDAGGKIIRREDDTPENVKKRLQLYHEETVPIIDYLKKVSNVFEINGEQPIDDVFKEIKEKLK